MLSQYAPPLVVSLIFCTHQYRVTVHHCYLCDRRRRGAQTSCLSGIEFPPHRTISILQGVLLVLSPNYHTVAIWLLNNCYYACRFKWEKYGTEHDYEWTNVVLNIIYCIYLQEAHSSQQTFWRNRFIMEYFRHEFKSTLNQSINQSVKQYMKWFLIEQYRDFRKNCFHDVLQVSSSVSFETEGVLNRSLSVSWRENI